MRKPAAAAVLGENLDALFALGRSPVKELRHDVFAILDSVTGTPDDSLLHEMADCAMHLPTSIRGLTDFYVGIHHAIRCGEIINGPHYQLPWNSRYITTKYNALDSTIQVSGTEVHSPLGLRRS